MALTYGVARYLSDPEAFNTFRMSLRDRNRSKQLIHSEDFFDITAMGLSLMIFGLVGICETPIMPFELASDGINAIYSKIIRRNKEK